MKGIFQNKWSVIGIAVLCSILWGSAFPVLKLSYEELQMAPDDLVAKIVFAGMRFLLAGVLVLVFLLASNRKQLLITKRQFLVLTLLGIVQTSLQYFFFYNGLANVSGMQGAILSSAGAFFTVILAHFYYRNDRMNWRKTIGLITGFLGIIVVNWGEELSFSFHIDGEGFMILSGVTVAVATIMAKELATGIHPIAITGWQLLLGGAIMLLIGFPILSEDAIVFTPFGTGLFLYSALLSAVAFALWYSLLKYNQASKLSMYKFIVPVSGACMSALFIPNETLNGFIFAAIVLVAIGIIIVNSQGRERVQVKLPPNAR
ncbi:DMT family transporter [Ornithinibacillus xuwenensis]|uniref:DMT family transporter n=1 Tax=Ornithinibacillus xuwenensis TaxID=3144668 RepID=A0ABU9XPH1_9BACI